MKQENIQMIYAFVEIREGRVNTYQLPSQELQDIMVNTAQQEGHTYLAYTYEEGTR